ncbi:MAG: alpha/beta fold hydrolase [Candidatus Thiodiazotropha sp.]
MLLVACASPSQRFDQMAQNHGFDKIEVEGNRFTHVAFANGKLGTASTLHVYLGGDGTPWIGGFIIASDPTPRKPVVLKLMELDQLPSLFLGRPCYHGQAKRQPCSSDYWTSSRYSKEVIDSMSEALRKVMSKHGHTRLQLMGFSGGGGLAMLLAERFPETQAIVTIAGNLDIESWVDLHSYDPLDGSLNPKSMPALPGTIRQYHLAGGKDTNIPAGMIRDALINQPESQFILFEDFTHGCCWERVWEGLLTCVEKQCEWENAYQH